MIYSEKQYKLLEEQLKKTIKENELKDKENKILKTQLKRKDEVITDLDKNDYKGKFKSENKEKKEVQKKLLKKDLDLEKKDELIEIYKKKLQDANSKLKIYKKELSKYKIQVEKNSTNSSKPSSTDGFKKHVTNRRTASTKSRGRTKRT